MGNSYTIEDISLLLSGFYKVYSIRNRSELLDTSVVNTLDSLLKELSVLSEKEIPKKYKIINKECTVEKFLEIYSYISKTINFINENNTSPIYIKTNDSQLYYSFRSKIATQDFASNGDNWPTANLSIDSESVQALAVLKPPIEEGQQNMLIVPNQMSEYIKNMNDLTADVYDIINNEWINNAISEDSMITITAADILKYRGIQPRGKNNNYHKTALETIARQIEILDQTWIKVFEASIPTSRKKSKDAADIYIGETKAIVLTSRVRHINSADKTVEPYSWRIRPGDCFSKYLFGPGRQRAMLSQKAVTYDYYRQKYEKRLTRFLSWEWGISSKSVTSGGYEVFKVETLLDSISFKIDENKPSISKEKFEKILNTLENDNVIDSWHYAVSDTEFSYGEKFWLKKWLNWDIFIKPPIDMIEARNEFQTCGPDLGSLLKETRIKRKYSQLALSVILNTSRSTVSKIESGKQQISPELEEAIRKWIES